MLQSGILNPALLSLLARTRHTNTLVIADRGFPSWPGMETVDLSLVDDIPQVLDVLRAIRANFIYGRVYMAEEFVLRNPEPVRHAFQQAIGGAPVVFEPHVEFKRRVPQATGLIRTGDTAQYANMILESA
jgi:D-ribose pyranase